MYNFIKGPVITEKSAAANDVGVYIFEVSSSANKVAIKKAIKALYAVDVDSVRIINAKSKSRLGKRGQAMVKRPSYKKAIIKLKDAKTIDINVFAKENAEKKK